MGSPTSYTLADVARHSSPDDLWIVIEGNDYREDHPGGDEILRQFAGKNATTEFQDAGHSNDAYMRLKTLLVGSLESKNMPKDFTERDSCIVPITVSHGDKNSTQEQTIIGQNTKQYGQLSSTMLAGGLAWLLYALRQQDWHAIQGYLPQAEVLRVPSSGWIVYLGGFLTATTINIAAATIVGFKAKKTILLRHRQLEDYPRVKQHFLPLASKGFGIVMDRQQITPSVYRVRLQGDTLVIGLGQHLKLLAEIDGAVVQRSYTPVSPIGNSAEVDLIIKVYPKGQLGNYLLNLPLQSRVEIRGPFGRYSPNPAWKRIACIAGGTGISPIYQVMRDWSGEVTLLYGNQTWEDILLREELEQLVLRSPGRVKVHHVLGQPKQDWKGLTGWITRAMVQDLLPKPSSSTGILVCGPDGLVRAIRGHFEAIHTDGEEKANVFVF
ncbi:hypothetical protein BJY01DRAFT_234780 [Aspergillus pseudoustus]|uniref:FAD-binding FR-type domain-containing protein n=1 Tax=Aspergillus pseudoustus TaxID=1810923 RepID=A0ABR4K0L9_9EURO